MSDVNDLVAFLRARLDEDETFASAARDAFYPQPSQEQIDGQWLSERNALAVRFNPARVLAEVEATRRLLAEYEVALAVSATEQPNVSERMKFVGAALMTAVQYVALPFADHPDYRPEWRP